METCSDEFVRLTSRFGGIECDGAAFVAFQPPWTLDHPSMALIELTLVFGAIACLVHAMRRLRLDHDPTNLVVYFAALGTLFLVEPFTYFPEWFGLERTLGLTFVHNQFSVQFFFRRMPLYIVAMYPAYTYLAYVLVQRSGIFERFPIVVGAVAVGVGFHAFYEIVDMIAPQLGWWTWNDRLEVLRPTIGGDPVVCLQAFGFAFPAGIALTARWLATRKGGGRVARDALASAFATYPVVLVLVTVPNAAFALAGLAEQTARLVAFVALAVVALAVTAYAFAVVSKERAKGSLVLPDGLVNDRFGLVASVAYLFVTAILWAMALPDYVAARAGFTSAGMPTGSLAYASVAAILSIGFVVGAFADGLRQGRTPRPDALNLKETTS